MGTDQIRILVVDDEHCGLELMERILRKLGSVECVKSGTHAWERCLEDQFHLVISDQRMPGLSGVELLTKVAEKSPTCGRILLTGYADAAVTIAAINEGQIHAYLSKPCAPDQLRMMAQSVLERVRAEQDNAELLSQLQEQREELEETITALREEARLMLEGTRAEVLAELHHQIAPAVSVLRELSEGSERSGSRGASVPNDSFRDALGTIEAALSLAIVDEERR